MGTGIRPGVVDVPSEVRNRISLASGIRVDLLEDKHELLKDLRMSPPACVSLSQSLDLFVRRLNSRGRILLTDIQSRTATVGSTVSLVDQEIQGR
jgi:hypothetical protein